MNPTHPLNQWPLKKGLKFFVKQLLNTPITKQRKLDINNFCLICFQLCTWKCAHTFPSLNMCKYIKKSKFINFITFHTHNYAQKQTLCVGQPNSLNIFLSKARCLVIKAFKNVPPMFNYQVMFGGGYVFPTFTHLNWTSNS